MPTRLTARLTTDSLIGRDGLNPAYINDPTQKRLDCLTIVLDRDTIELRF